MKPDIAHSQLSPRFSRLAILLSGLVACATPTRYAESRPLRSSGSGYEVQVLVDGSPAPTFWHHGETFVMGSVGERYIIRVHNNTGRRVEAVVTVDGRDVVDGKPGDYRNKRGYLVPAWGEVDIDGWRLSQSHAAAFRFSSVSDSYAARTGSAREVGVIGVAVFPERIYHPRPVMPPPPPPRCCFDEDRVESESYAPSASPARKMEAPAEATKSPASSRPEPFPDGRRGFGSTSGEAKAKDSRFSSHSRRPGLGTEFGESVNSQIQEVEFVRASSSMPAVVLGMRYNDHDGLVAMGVNVDGVAPWPGDSELRRTADPFPGSPRRYAAPPAGWQRY
jgi:hypothetical protein